MGLKNTKKNFDLFKSFFCFVRIRKKKKEKKKKKKN